METSDMTGEIVASGTGLSAGLSALADDVVLDFVNGLPGFPDAHRFRVVPLAADMEPFCRLQSVDREDIAFVVVPPGALFSDYSVVVDDEQLALLELSDSGDAVVLGIVTLAAPPTAPTVNLLGPIVVNRRTCAAAQVVQVHSAYGVAVPLVPLSASAGA